MTCACRIISDRDNDRGVLEHRIEWCALHASTIQLRSALVAVLRCAHYRRAEDVGTWIEVPEIVRSAGDQLLHDVAAALGRSGMDLHELNALVGFDVVRAAMAKEP